MILLDSNIVIYAAQPAFKELRNWLRGQLFSVSQLTRLEVLGYHRIADDEFSWFTVFFDKIELIPISNEIIEAAISLRRSYKMSLGDSVIAATAMKYNLELCTNNQKDFQPVVNLRMINFKKFIP